MRGCDEVPMENSPPEQLRLSEQLLQMRHLVQVHCKLEGGEGEGGGGEGREGNGGRQDTVCARTRWEKDQSTTSTSSALSAKRKSPMMPKAK